jgi:hypothetical protein
VLIAPGIYPWTPAVVNHQLTIEGLSGALATRFEGGGNAVLPLIACNPGPGATVTIRNIHLDHGRGIHASTGGLLVERCLFTRNTQGLLIEGTADFTEAALQSCAFVSNGGAMVEQAGGVGVYVHAQGAAGASLDSCVFIENMAKEGGGLHTQFSSTSVSRSIFARNSATVYSGGAIARWWGHAAIAVTGCHFDGNSAAWGGTQNWNCCIGCSDCVFSSAFDTTTDCNGNLIPDIAEIRVDPGLDQDSNGVLDACEAPLCLGDVDASSSVDGVDLAIIIQNWGTPSPKYPAADVTGDGQVDGADLAIVLSNWGPCP